MEFMPVQMPKVVKGRKLLELDVIDSMEFESKLKRAKQLQDEKLRTELDIQEISIWMRKWWLEIRKKNKIEVENVIFDEGGVYEGKVEQ